MNADSGLRHRLPVLVLAGLAALAAFPARAGDPAPGAPDIAALRKAADGGAADAAFSLGDLYWSGFGVVQDYLAAANWLGKAAEHGHAEAQCALGLLYQTGTYADNGPQDLAKAASWYRRAADQGSGCGQFALAALYEAGTGLAKDDAAAADLYAKAATQGFVADKASFPLQQVFAHFRDTARQLAGTADAPPTR